MSGRARDRARAHGFTLVELMVVIVIIGMVGTVAVMSWASSLPKQRFHTAIRNLSEVLYGTRSEAIARNREFRILYDIANDTYRVRTPYRQGGGFATSDDDPERLWAHEENLAAYGIDLQEITIDDMTYSDGQVEVYFQPLGAASHHTIRLRHTELMEDYTLEVLPLTGEIRMHEGAFVREPVDEGDFK